ncbi:hypothetical protein TVAG_031900 [Trichomonas vaginalis G3]|uniref:Uncharacterized protein n=1 Tax=Trichomonas vaginalis (strain ATCC PRA-98 / G3) TaxID=412133 RepID=A2EUI9_TRIV3|nr:hypothetical protein TVAGG3_0363180 [Trichomonas vaginalis G3]EAY03691.1 hypothetical protein TVAG_031900 [Trichomonas vaginalis G3]KAI5532086.1 hypothetical protein TVAGG3_0363180 [Trichomonas vaginalis G3]|eukprot:XP_001315914.1 hypothetical protein [Trichomonas vaginalis G3]
MFFALVINSLSTKVILKNATPISFAGQLKRPQVMPVPDKERTVLSQPEENWESAFKDRIDYTGGRKFSQAVYRVPKQSTTPRFYSVEANKAPKLQRPVPNWGSRGSDHADSGCGGHGGYC